MRTIKFRAKRVDNKEWVYGNLYIPERGIRGVYICPETTYIDFYPGYEDGENLAEFKNRGISLGHFIEVIPETVGQFTNLYDKNKEEIYEGDVVFYDYMRWEVVFDYDRWDMKNGDKYVREDNLSDDPGLTQWEQSWKTGNIHDNPELLK